MRTTLNGKPWKSRISLCLKFPAVLSCRLTPLHRVCNLDRLFETSFARDESSVSNAGVGAIPSQLKVTKQILLHWHPFRDLKLKYVGSRQPEQLSLLSQQRIVTTVEESVLTTEMADLESQEEDAPKCILFFKPMSWLGQIRTHRRHESWSASHWQTFFSTSMDAQIPVIVEKSLVVCGCRKFGIDALGDHLCTCTGAPLTRVPKRITTGWLINLLIFFAQHIELKHNRWLKVGVSIVGTSN
jgi:hypothetical protein